MKMKRINRGDTADVQLIGRLDVNAAAEAEKALLETADRFHTVNLDLGQLEYISSGGLRAIKNFYVQVRKNGGEYTVKNVPKSIMEIFEVTGFVRLLKL